MRQRGEALFLATNVLDRNILEQNLADILKAYGRVDALLNAAGGNMPELRLHRQVTSSI